jgi:hypothetical protein
MLSIPGLKRLDEIQVAVSDSVFFVNQGYADCQKQGKAKPVISRLSGLFGRFP